MCYHFAIPMQRWFANLALVAICVGTLSPFFAAAQVSSVHACCLRNGAHHCADSADPSSEHTVRVKCSACPWNVANSGTSAQGLHAARFSFCVLTEADTVALASIDGDDQLVPSGRSARSPPSSLLN